MDFFEILIILLFIVLPLLQQVLGQRGEGGGPDETADGEGERLPGHRTGVERPHREEERPAGAAQERSRTPSREEPSAPGGWSADWGEWPGDEEDEAEDEAGLDEISAAEIPDEVRGRAPREQPMGHDAPEQIRLATQVVSLEPLHVDRRAEHARLHARRSADVEPVELRVARLAGLIEGRDDLRRAILLAEVVGPPAALRGPPGPPGIT